MACEAGAEGRVATLSRPHHMQMSRSISIYTVATRVERGQRGGIRARVVGPVAVKQARRGVFVKK
jgi:hypothetical protein